MLHDEVDTTARFAVHTWNSAEQIARHRALTPGERMALAIEVSRVALAFAHARRASPERDDGAAAV